MRKNNNILITGGYDTKNLGDYGSLEILIKILKKNKNTKKSNLFFMSRHPSKKIDNYFDLTSFKNFEFNNKLESKNKIFKGFNNPNENNKVLKKITNSFKNSKLVIIGNGRLLNSISFDFMRGPLFYYFLVAYNCRLLGRPLYIFSQTILKLKNPFHNKMLKFIIENATSVTVREKNSLNNLSKMKISTKNVKIIPDACFGIEPIKKSVLSKSLMKKIEGSIILNMRSDCYSDKRVKLVEKVAVQIAKFLNKKTKRKIILLNQKTYNTDNKDHDDRHLNKNIKQKINSKNIIYITKELKLNEILSFYKLASFTVTMRRHGFLFSISQKTPAFAISHHQGTNYILDFFYRKKPFFNIENFSKKKLEIILKAFNKKSELQKNQYKTFQKYKKNIFSQYSKSIDNCFQINEK